MKTLWRFVTGKLRSRVYALSYLGCIPLFAVLYWSYADEFHHTTVQYERSLAADFDAIRSQLNDELNRHIRMQYGKSKVVDQGWTLKGNAVSLTGGKLEGYRFQFNLELALEKPGENGPKQLSGNTTIMSFGGEYFPIFNDNAEISYYMIKIKFEGDFLTDEFDPYVLLANYPRGFSGRRIQLLPITTELAGRLGAYIRAMEGFPAWSSGSLGRMFYLSVVTITTLGYGDILPLTPWARILVSTEAILGVVLIGYYLSSLSNPVGTKSDGPRRRRVPARFRNHTRPIGHSRIRRPGRRRRRFPDSPGESPDSNGDSPASSG